MLYFGECITAPADVLKPIALDDLYQLIVSPTERIKQLVGQLQIVRSIDAKRYSALKRNLPYFVCGVFNPAVRKTENFAHISYFVVDIDHISDKGYTLDGLRNKLYADSRVCMGYVSPSQDGIKLLFRLKERCYDFGVFSVFYKQFLSQFALEYDLEQVVDSRTSDVTRACFLSVDESAHCNPMADMVDINVYITQDNPLSLFDQKRQIDKEEKNIIAEKIATEPDSLATDRIKEVLGLYRAKQQKNLVYVPEQLNAIMEQLSDFLASLGMPVLEVKDISYGKKIRITAGLKHAECNLFYGKRGFTAVKSPRTGTDAELNDMLQELIYAFLSELH